MRLIDADKLPKYTGYALSANEVAMAVENAPTVDAVPVVRCAKCKMHDNCYTEDVFKFVKLNNDKRFCGVGERKEGDE